METIIIIILCCILVLFIVGLIVILIEIKKNNSSKEILLSSFDKYEEELKNKFSDEIEIKTKYLNNTINTQTTVFVTSFKPYMDSFENKLDLEKKQIEDKFNDLKTEVSYKLDKIRNESKQSLTEVREENDKHMAALQLSNETKLEKMRHTVDEKLEKTLNERIQTAFAIVNTNLEQMQKSFGEVNELSKQMSNLNKSFTNVKTRGTWGEVGLEFLLSQMLAPEQYVAQKQLDPKSTERVDFAIKMPGTKNDSVYLPIDAKFPNSSYQLLLDAQTKEEIEKARKELFKRILTEAESIQKKYIMEPITTNFAVMYLATEGLYAEVVKDPTLCETLQTKYHVIPCGPTVLAALLNSLQVGFNTMKIQKNSGEIVKLMQSFKKEFETFTNLIEKVKKNADSVVTSLAAVTKKNDKIIKNLDKIDDIELDYEENKQIQETSSNSAEE